MNKRGQIWYGDFIIGLLVITILTVAFYYVLYDIGNANSEIDNLEVNIESLANNLMSDGYGSWTTATTVSGLDYDGKIGLVNNSKIDSNLINKFKNLNLPQMQNSNIKPYSFTKTMLGLSEYDYSAFIIYKNGSKEKLAAFLPAESEIDNAANVIKMDRLVYYNMEIVRLNIIIYKK